MIRLLFVAGLVLVTVLALYAFQPDKRSTAAVYKSYKIVKTSSPASLSNIVSTEMESRWQPVGGVCFTGREYLQAMAR